MITTLYTKYPSGGTGVWSIEIEGNKYRSTTGMVGGKLTVGEWHYAESKSVGAADETTPQQQAQLEVDSIIRQKRERNYVDRIEDIDKQVYLSPMLAKKYDDYITRLKWPVDSQPKLDGIRCTIDHRGMLSRGGKPIVAAPHIMEALQAKVDEGISFDGELYNHDLKHDFNKIISLVRKLKPTEADLKESREKVQFWCYDIIDTSKSFEDRFIKQDHFAGINDKCIVRVPSILAKNHEEVQRLHGQYLEEGYEGSIIRDPNAVYKHTRTDALLKYKDFKDAEWEILDVVEGVGARTGTVGFCIMKHHDGSTFKCNVKGNFDYLADFLKNKDKHIGHMATIKYFNLTPDRGIPRFGYIIKVRDEIEG